MVDSARFYTAAEAGVISGLGRKVIDNAIDKKLIPPRRHGGGPSPERVTRQARRISEVELLWVYLHHAARGAIPSDEREAVYECYLRNPRASELRISNLVVLDLAQARKDVDERAARLDRAVRNVVSDPEVLRGEPVIRNTRIPVYDIAASVAKGFPATRIRAAYSLLDEEAIEDAVIYATAFPPRGRPRGAPKTHPPLRQVEKSIRMRKPSG
jgi:uncharacterized protein (DUF433 family)